MKLSLLSFLTITLISACTGTVKKSQKEKTAIPKSDSIAVKLEPVSNIAQLPVQMNEPIAGGDLFVTDVTGKIWIIKKDSMLPKPFWDKFGNKYQPSPNSSLGRLYSLAFDPDFSINHKFYVSYAGPSEKNKKNGKLIISRFTTDPADPDKADPASEKKVLDVEGRIVAFNGSQIAFGPDRYLYISIGDDKAGDTTYKFQGQNLDDLEGKLLRIDVSNIPYSIPPDNPFVNVKDARPEIWAYGFRKLWHYSFDPQTHQLYGGDVGEETEEEIDFVNKGGNYGWPVKEGDETFEKNGDTGKSDFVKPVYTYSHAKGICVIGGNFYYGKDLPQLTKKYVFADWEGKLFALDKEANDQWNCIPLKIVNEPSTPFFICACYIDAANNLYVMGYLQAKDKINGVIYKIIKA
ncbi:MAG TPA: PQQ-dependent sugar dehydrogenase [Hanamia sp.]|nr:PQQ-dependent sugar dehydrogenase [Hanamia sp.]